MKRITIYTLFCLFPLIASAADLTSVPSAGKTVQLYFNFSSHPTFRYDIAGAWREDGGPGDGGANQIVAMAFTPNVTSLLLPIDAAITSKDTKTSGALLLAEDNKGLPGAVIASMPVNGLPKYETCCKVVQLNYDPTTNPILLTRGKTYWIYPVLSNGQSGAWNYNNVGVNGSMAISFDGGATFSTFGDSPNGAFDVYGFGKAN